MRISIGDVTLFFDVEGAKLRPDGARMREAPTLIVLHGGPGFDHSSFKPAFSQMSGVAQVIYLDHRGQGRSDRGDPARWNIAQWGDDVRAFCDALEIERPIVLGQSFGGFVAMSYATRHRGHPAKLVLSSTCARLRFDRALAMFERLGGAEPRAAAERFFANPGPETLPDYRAKCFPLYARRGFDADSNARTIFNLDLMFSFFRDEGAAMNLLPELARVNCPTLVFAGERDPITPLADAQDIVAALPQGIARFERADNAGHGVYRDDPERFFRVLREFIAS
ncbi:MAG: alpha/beta fold hydrolase [Candidatus Binataceae bacterium]